MRKILLAGATAAVLALGGVVGAVPASAAPAAPAALCPQSGADKDTGSGHAKEPAQIRSGPSTQCDAPGAAQPSDVLGYFCSKTVSGYKWTYLRDGRTGVVGWVRGDLLNNGGSTKTC